MKLLALTDLHLTSNKPVSRIGDFIADVDAKLSEVTKIAKEYNVSAVLCAGDVFHSPNVTYITVVRFLSFLEKLGVRFITITGSHDLFGRNMDALYRTALGLLERLRVIELLYEGVRPTTRVGSITIGIPGTITDIEMVHGSVLPFKDVGEYTLLQDYKTNAKLVIVGHYHNGYPISTVNGTTFICPGSLVRVSAAESELTRIPRVAIIDDDFSVEWVYLKSAKAGKSVLSAPMVYKQPDFKGLVSDWRVSSIENIDAASLLKEIAAKEGVSDQVLAFALNFLAKQGGAHG